MLWPLVNKIPAQVREANEVRHYETRAREYLGIATRDTGFHLHLFLLWFIQGFGQAFRPSQFVNTL
jgi:hypothetical protein